MLSTALHAIPALQKASQEVRYLWKEFGSTCPKNVLGCGSVPSKGVQSHLEVIPIELPVTIHLRSSPKYPHWEPLLQDNKKTCFCFSLLQKVSYSLDTTLGHLCAEFWIRITKHQEEHYFTKLHFRCSLFNHLEKSILQAFFYMKLLT